jgi:selenium metabolism protein YedF
MPQDQTNDIIDMRGKPCPLPVVAAKNALRDAPPGSTVHVLVDNDIARQNLEKLAGGIGASSSWEKQGDTFLVNIVSPAATTGGGQPAAADTVIVFGSNIMGRGDDTLGQILMKSFIFSLAQLDDPPRTMLFYNSGVLLTGPDSPAIPELKALEARGVSIASCGDCVKFYGLVDKLAVGGITTMYLIASALNDAAKVIYP